MCVAAARRGYGSEATLGRLLLQKLDYLQLLLIKRAAKGLSTLAATSSQQLLQQLCLLYEALGGTLPHSEQRKSVQEEVVPGMQEAAADATSERGDGPAGSAAAGTASDPPASTGAPPAAAAGNEAEEEPGGEPAAAVDVMQANLQRTQAAAAAAASSAEKAVTSAATSTLRRLQRRLVESGQQLAEAMSDWGLIPRLGVIPLEQFEEVYPVQEPGRLRPLYIQKASLPDILGGCGLRG